MLQQTDISQLIEDILHQLLGSDATRRWLDGTHDAESVLPDRPELLNLLASLAHDQPSRQVQIVLSPGFIPRLAATVRSGGELMRRPALDLVMSLRDAIGDESAMGQAMLHVALRGRREQVDVELAQDWIASQSTLNPSADIIERRMLDLIESREERAQIIAAGFIRCIAERHELWPSVKNAVLTRLTNKTTIAGRVEFLKLIEVCPSAFVGDEDLFAKLEQLAQNKRKRLSSAARNALRTLRNWSPGTKAAVHEHHVDSATDEFRTLFDGLDGELGGWASFRAIRARREEIVRYPRLCRDLVAIAASDGHSAGGAISAIARLGSAGAACPALCIALAELIRDPATRGLGIHIVGKMAERHGHQPGLLTILVELARDEDENIRRESIEAIGWYEKWAIAHPAALDAVFDALMDISDPVSSAVHIWGLPCWSASAGHALLHLAPHATEEPAFFERVRSTALTSESPAVRETCAHALRIMIEDQDRRTQHRQRRRNRRA